ncbi:MAG TPA: hypothetical protein VN626_04785 [Clostridia bacterium]|nr:hypothetical protein [Clostridia bacterium]
MKAELCLRETHNRLQNTLRSCVALFREGQDNLGLDELIGSIEDLEYILDIFQCSGEADFSFDNILLEYRKLLDRMRNLDLAGVTDLLEFTIIPLSETWAARWDAVCR